MLGKHTQDGLTLVVYSTLYMDYGLLIVDAEDEERVLFNNPHVLSHESWGLKPNPSHGLDWEEAEAEMDKNGMVRVDGLEWYAFIPYTEADWSERLEEEFNELVECFLPEEPEEQEFLVSVEGKGDKPRPERAKTAHEAVKERFISDMYNLTPYQHPEGFVYLCEGQRFQCESSMESGTFCYVLADKA